MRIPTIVLLLVGALTTPLSADDWPQWLGPWRDGVWREAGIAETIPEKGPVVRWRAPVGGGYAGPAVANGKVFVLDRHDAPKGSATADQLKQTGAPGTERVICLSESDGRELWTHEYDCPYRVSYASGPRTTPTVDGDRVYTLGAMGHLLCLDVATGKPLWKESLEGSRSPTPTWGFASSPLVDGDNLICLTGGTTEDGKGTVVTAFDKRTGEVRWTSLSAKEPGYCPPVIYEGDGDRAHRQLIIWTPQTLNGLDPATGDVFWSIPFGPVENGVSIATPVLHHDPKLGDVVMVSSAWDGAMVVQLDPKDPKKVKSLWKRGGNVRKRKTDAIHALMCTPTIRDAHIYGVCVGGELRCLDLATGDRVWETFAATNPNGEPLEWSNAFVVPIGDAGNRFVLANEHGDVIFATLAPAGYKETGRAHLLDPTNNDAGRPTLWCHPAYANRSIYWRNDKEIVCASLAAADQK